MSFALLKRLSVNSNSFRLLHSLYIQLILVLRHLLLPGNQLCSGGVLRGCGQVLASLLGHLTKGSFGLLRSVFWWDFILHFSQEIFIWHCDSQNFCLSLSKITGHDWLSDGYSHKTVMTIYGRWWCEQWLCCQTCSRWIVRCNVNPNQDSLCSLVITGL